MGGLGSGVLDVGKKNVVFSERASCQDFHKIDVGVARADGRIGVNEYRL